jgi:hypothetical protein
MSNSWRKFILISCRIWWNNFVMILEQSHWTEAKLYWMSSQGGRNFVWNISCVFWHGFWAETFCHNYQDFAQVNRAHSCHEQNIQKVLKSLTCNFYFRTKLVIITFKFSNQIVWLEEIENTWSILSWLLSFSKTFRSKT